MVSKDYDRFGENDIQLAEVIGSPIALAIENANLYTKIQDIDQFSVALMNSIHAAVLTVQDHKILWCNHTTLDLFGYDPGELVGKSTKVLVADTTTYKTITRNIDHAIKTMGSFCFLFDAKKKDGETFKSECCISILKQVGDDPHITVAVIRDISEK